MLRKISFKNYKSFKAKQTIDLNNVTVLVGPNSAGKSSIIKLLALLKQSLDGSPSNHELLNIRGDLVDAVDFNNLSYRKKGKDIQVEIEGTWYWPSSGINYLSSVTGWASIIKYNFSQLFKSNKIEYGIESWKSKKKVFIDEFSLKNEPATHGFNQYFYLESKKVKQIERDLGKKIFKIIDNISSGYYNKPGFFKNKTFLKNYIEERLERMFYYKPGIKNLKPYPEDKNLRRIQYFRGLDPNENKFLKSCSLYKTFNKRDVLGLGLHFKKDDKVTSCPFELLSHEELESSHPFKNENFISCDTLKDLTKKIKNHFVDIDQTDKNLTEYISYQLLVYVELFLINFELFNKSNYTISETISTKINSCSESISNAFSGIRFSPPLREKPKKHQSRSELKEIYSLSPSTDLKLWNKAFEEIGFNYEISVEEISKSHDLYAIKLKDKLSGVESYLDEVGYGFSQFLPYLGWKFGRYSDLKVYEQPELHLHPSAQAKLPEILIKNLSERAGEEIKIDGPDIECLVMDDDMKITTEYGQSSNTISLTENGYNLIETHSEHILRGVQLLVAKGLLKPEEVSIYYVGKNKSGNSYVKKHELDENGRFVDKWPEGFFDIGFNQAMELMKAR